MGRFLIDEKRIWARVAALGETRSEEVLTSLRPRLAESQPRVAPMSESEQMRNIEARTGEPNNDAKVLYLTPKDARRRLFFTVDRFLAAAAPRGSEACARATRRADREFAAPSPTGFATVDAGMEDEARTILRARCAICSVKCSRPLI